MGLVKLVEKSGRLVEEFELRRPEDGERIGDDETTDIVGFTYMGPSNSKADDCTRPESE